MKTTDRNDTTWAGGAGIPWMTLLALLAVAAGYLWQMRAAGHAGEFSADELAWMGGNVPPLSLGSAPWRLATSLLLHGSLIHLLSNAVALLLVGATLEWLIGRARWLAVFVVGGLASSFASACLNYDRVHHNFFGQRVQELSIGVGVSGAIMSLAGATIALGIYQLLGSGQQVRSTSLLRGALVVSVLNLVYGFIQADVDNAAHVAGLLFGMVAGFFLLTSPRDMGRATLHGIRLACAVLFAVGLWSLWEMLPAPADRVPLIASARATIEDGLRARRLAIVREAEQAQPLSYVGEEQAMGWTVAIPGVVRIVPADTDGKVYLATNDEASRILEYDLSQGAVSKTIAVVPYAPGSLWGCPVEQCWGVGISDLAVDAKQGKAYASTLSKGSVSRVDMASGRVDYTVHTGRFPSRILLKDGRLYAYDRMDNTLTVLDAAAGTLVKRVALPGRGQQDAQQYEWPRGQDLVVAADGRSLFLQTPDQRSVHVDLETLSASLDGPQDVRAVGRDGGGRIWFLTGEGVVYPGEKVSHEPVPYRLAQDGANLDAGINDSFIDPDGSRPLILHLTSLGAILGISSISTNVRRLWPSVNGSGDAFGIEILDSHRFYLPGRSNTQILTVERSMAPGDVGAMYESRLGDTGQSSQ